MKLKKITLQGYKSIEKIDGFEFRNLNVLIGPNAAGKSNFISFFRLLSWMMAEPNGNLQQFILGRGGGGNALLFDGAKTTPQMDAELTFETETGFNDYFFRLFHGAPDRLIFADEKYRFSNKQLPSKAPWTTLFSGHDEAQILVARKLAGNTTARMIVGMLRNCVVYQFHDTSEKAGIRTFWSKSDNRFLKENGANLAPVLLRLKENRRENYNRIIEIISQLLPHFADFFLEPDDNSLLLRWKEIGTDTIFDSHQASDGSLRIMALITLLLRPQNEIPDLLILDEPELGLHPKAIHVIAGLIKSVSVNKQVVLATQSKELVDQFEPEDVITLERKSRGTVLKRLNSEALGEWLQEYSLGDLWEKNVIGGRP